MRFDIITIFPQIFDSYFGESIVSRAQKEKLINIKIHNLRDFATDKHKTVDDTPYGGGAGMVMKVEPIYKAVEEIKSQFQNLNPPAGRAGIKKNPKSEFEKVRDRVILFSAKGKRYTQDDARRLLKYDNLILICGRYEGVDERVADHIADEEISIGEYVLTGGEIPAMVLADSITRLLPGVLGNPDSLKEESFGNLKNNEAKKLKAILEYPQYTKPEIFFAEKKSGGQEWKVPKVLLSGNHKEIENWRNKKTK